MLSINTFIRRHYSNLFHQQPAFIRRNEKNLLLFQFLSYLLSSTIFVIWFFGFSFRMHLFHLFDSFILWFYTISHHYHRYCQSLFRFWKKKECFYSKTDSKSAFIFDMDVSIEHWAWSLSDDHCSLSTSRNLYCTSTKSISSSSSTTYYAFDTKIVLYWETGFGLDDWMVGEQFARISICIMKFTISSLKSFQIC